MEQVLTIDIITFTEDELIKDGTDHIKYLNLTLEFEGMNVTRVLIDNSSTLNVCPLIIIDRLGVDRSCIRKMGSW